MLYVSFRKHQNSDHPGHVVLFMDIGRDLVRMEYGGDGFEFTDGLTDITDVVNNDRNIVFQVNDGWNYTYDKDIEPETGKYFEIFDDIIMMLEKYGDSYRRNGMDVVHCCSSFVAKVLRLNEPYYYNSKRLLNYLSENPEKYQRLKKGMGYEFR